MTIAINSACFIQSGYKDFFYEYFVKIAASNPQHQFIFITPSVSDDHSINSNNINQVISFPAGNNPLMWKIWLDYTLPGIARKYKADIFINTGGVCSLRTKVPQYLFISDLSFLNFQEYFSKKQEHFLKKYMPAFLNKANTILTASDFLKTEIIQTFSIHKEKIDTLPLIPGDLYKPVGWKEKEEIKEKYAEGKEYFLFSGEIHPRNNLVNLLKAFSFFKKRQKSNMQLIITAKAVSAKNPFIENLNTYKYRKEVSLLSDLPEKDLAKITAGAYAFLYPSMYEGMTLFPLQAIQCEVPVITTNNGALNEFTVDTVLYADPLNFEDIADKMMLVFKNETKRTELIKGGKLFAQKKYIDNMTNRWWNSILKPNG